MRPFFCTRIHRRFVVKYFGSLRNLLLWTLGVSLTVYILDNYFFSIDHIKQNTAEEVEAMKQAISDKLPDAAAPVDPNAAADDKVSKSSCGQATVCPEGQYSYLIKSGFEKDGHPTVCFNGQFAFSPEKKNGKRGIAMAVVNDKTQKIEDVRTFDTYEDDNVLLRYVRLGVEKSHLILLATTDEASLHLTAASRKILESFGSEQISKLEFRDSFVMIGQRGLVSPAKAIEQHLTRQEGKSYADQAEVRGCISIPMGSIQLSDIQDNPAPVAPVESLVKLGDTFTNCGLPDACPADSFSVRLFSGKENKDLPMICFNGKYVIAPELNNPGRGINIAVFNGDNGAVNQVARFDTYESAEQSHALVTFVSAMKENEVLLAVAHDEAQTSLKEDAIQALEKLGSSFISKLAFRDVWIFVGRPNLKGFTPYEDIEFGGHDSWPFSIDKKFCIAKQFKASDKKVDIDSKKNIPKRTFCKKYDGYEDFCSGASIDERPAPAVQTDPSMKDNEIYKIPIVVIPGLSHVSTLMQFQALLAIPGILPEMITVMFDQKFEESGLLAGLFGFPTVQLESSTKYVYLIEKAFEEAWKKFPTADLVIILEEEVIPSKDFLFFMAQCLDALKKDESLVGITSFNENGFEGVSTMPDLVYRGRSFPGLGFMLKKSFYIANMQGKMSNCCLKRSWYSWFFRELGDKEMIIPDISRVARRQFLGLTENADLIREYFNRHRVTSKGEFVTLKNSKTLTKDDYEGDVNVLIKDSTALETDKFGECASGSGHGFNIPSTQGKTFSIFFEQENEDDELVLSRLCKCFKLFFATGYKLKGLHKSMMRFSYEGNQIFLVGQSSPYYKHRPSSYKSVQKTQISAKL